MSCGALYAGAPPLRFRSVFEDDIGQKVLNDWKIYTKNIILFPLDFYA